MPLLTEILAAKIGKNGKSKAYVADQLGVSERTVENYMNGTRQPKPGALVKLSNILGFNLNDLTVQNVPQETLAKEPGRDYMQERRDKKTNAPPQMIPLVPVKAQAGYARSYANTDFINQLDLFPILPGIDPRGAVWRFFEVQGDSMEPSLYNTDLVLVSMVPTEDWKEIKRGQVHVVITADQVLIKKVYQQDSDHLLLRSANKKHKDKIIAFSDIKEIWLYRRHVTNKIQL